MNYIAILKLAVAAALKNGKLFRVILNNKVYDSVEAVVNENSVTFMFDEPLTVDFAEQVNCHQYGVDIFDVFHNTITIFR